MAVQHQVERFAEIGSHLQRRPKAAAATPLRPGAPLTSATVQRLQAHGGNGAVAALLERERSDAEPSKTKPKSLGQIDKITDEKEKGKGATAQRSVGGALNQVGAAIERAFTGSAKVKPNFILSKPAAKRSNTDSSTTSGKNPTFTGSVVEQTKGTWNYRLDSVDAKGTIQIVYYDKSRYPAPF